MHGLPFRGFNMKNGARKPRSTLIQKYFLTCSHNVRGVQNFFMCKGFFKAHSLARRGLSGHYIGVIQCTTQLMPGLIFDE